MPSIEILLLEYEIPEIITETPNQDYKSLKIKRVLIDSLKNEKPRKLAV